MRKIIVAALLLRIMPLSADWVTVNYCIVNERQEPVRGVEIKTYTQRDAINLKWLGKIEERKITKISDENGKAKARFICHTGHFDVYVSADGYYSEKLLNQAFSANYDIDRRKYSFPSKEKTITITLLEKHNPVEMKMTNPGDWWRLPNKAGRYEFDLEKFDWVAPFGKGTTPDMAVVYNVLTNGADGANFYLSGELEFINGGAYRRKKRKSSSFYSDYNAQTNETYSARFPFVYWYKEATDRYAPDEYSYNQSVQDDEYLVFRVRERRDAQGHLISANYGKIYGHIRTSGMFEVGQIFFNPTSNDTNIEEKQRR